MAESGSSGLKNDRRKCYKSRDAYLTCIDSFLDIGKTEKEAERACRKERSGFETDCPSSWVGHFIRKHNFERIISAPADTRNNSQLRGSTSQTRTIWRMRRVLPRLVHRITPVPQFPAHHLFSTRSARLSDVSKGQKVGTLTTEDREKYCSRVRKLAKGDTQEVEKRVNRSLEAIKNGNQAGLFSSVYISELSTMHAFSILDQLCSKYDGDNGRIQALLKAKIYSNMIMLSCDLESGDLKMESLERIVQSMDRPVKEIAEDILCLLACARNDIPSLPSSPDSLPRTSKEEHAFNVALNFARAKDWTKFRTFFAASSTRILDDDVKCAGRLHFNLIKLASPSEVNWYVEELVKTQREPIDRAYFETFMLPVLRIAALSPRVLRGKELEKAKERLPPWNLLSAEETNRLGQIFTEYVRGKLQEGNRVKRLEELDKMLKVVEGMKKQRTKSAKWIVVDDRNVTHGGTFRGRAPGAMDSVSDYRTFRIGMKGAARKGDATSVSEYIEKLLVTRHLGADSNIARTILTFPNVLLSGTDDWFAIIAALRLGGCHIVSNDIYRDHKNEIQAFVKAKGLSRELPSQLAEFIRLASVRHKNGKVEVIDENSRGVVLIDGRIVFCVSSKRDTQDIRKFDYYNFPYPTNS